MSVYLACYMLEALTSNSVAKPRITPLPFAALKRNSSARVMLLFLADHCSSVLLENFKKRK